MQTLVRGAIGTGFGIADPDRGTSGCRSDAYSLRDLGFADAGGVDAHQLCCSDAGCVRRRVREQVARAVEKDRRGNAVSSERHAGFPGQADRFRRERAELSRRDAGVEYVLHGAAHITDFGARKIAKPWHAPQWVIAVLFGIRSGPGRNGNVTAAGKGSPGCRVTNIPRCP